MTKKSLETVPNYNEGHDMEKVTRIAAYFKNRKNVRFLDCQTGVNHSCCVITAVGELEAFRDAVIGSLEAVVQLIDMTKHERQRPRMDAAGVIPSVPCRNTTVAEANAIAKEIGKAVDEKFGIPVFLYEDSVTAPHRASLVKIRKGQFKSIAEKLQDKELWIPDLGPDHIHSTTGAVAIGARMPFTAYSMNLDTDNVEIANHIANAVKNIRGGYHFIKAIDAEPKDHYSGKDTMAQVPMNLVSYEKTAIYHAFEAIKVKARRYGANVLGNEIAGVVPMQPLIDCAEYYLQACMFGPMKSDTKKQTIKN